MPGPMSLAEFIANFGVAVGNIRPAEMRALDSAATLVEKEAKKEIGVYQSGAGPFAPWAELADSTKDERAKLGFSENDPGLRSGEMGADISHVVAANERAAAVGSNDDKLVWFELGTKHQPPRSVLGIAVVNNREKIGKIIGHHVAAALMGRGTTAVPENVTFKFQDESF